MVTRLKHLNYAVKKLKYIKTVFKSKKRRISFFEKKQRKLFRRFVRRKLRTNIKNRELLKYPLIMKYFSFLKSWKKPKLRSWRYFFSRKHKYFNVPAPTLRKWRKFRFFFKRRFFWYKNLSKRQNIILKKLYLSRLKASPKANYARLRNRFRVETYKQKRFYKWIKKIVVYMKTKRYSNMVKFYISLLIDKNNKNILVNSINLRKAGIFVFFCELFKCIFSFKEFEVFSHKLGKYHFFYNDLYIYKSYIYTRLKWLDRKRSGKKFFYPSSKSRRRANFFFRLRKKVLLMFDVNKIKKQFFHIKIRAVDTNLFLTLTNYKHEVIIYRSTGHVSESRKRKTKLSPFTINKMTFDVIKKIRDLKIQYMILNINTKMNRNIRNIFRSISTAVRVKIVQAHYSKPIPHHFGTKKPRPKRL